MKTMTVFRSSVFPAEKHEVFKMLTKLETLQDVASPFAEFLPVNDSGTGIWEEGTVSSYRFRLFGLIPFGTHTIHVVRFSETEGIFTNEYNEHVPVWNHEIILEDLSGRQCEYTDRVEIGAGWKTFFIWIWANAFYRHRQRKWIRLLKSTSGS